MVDAIDMTIVPPLTSSQVTWMWVSVALGTLLGLLFGVMAGPGKLVPGHPMYKAMEFGFDKVYGPFIGFDGGGLRFFVGLGEMLAGLGLLIGSWMYAFSVGGDRLCDLNAALQIVAAIGIMCAMLGAVATHMYVDGGKYGFVAFVAFLSMVFIAIRMFILGPFLFVNQVIATVGGSCMLLGMFVAIIINNNNGLHESQVEKEKEELDKIMNGEK